MMLTGWQKLRLLLVMLLALVAVFLAVGNMTGLLHDRSTSHLWYRALICGVSALCVLVAVKVVHRASTGEWGK